jgi:hypothetical protein
MPLTIDVPFSVAQDGPVNAESYKAFWATNPMPRALAKYWATHRRGHHGARRKNPLEQIGYPKRKLKTVEFRGGKGRWQKIAEALRNKMKRATNPYPTMAMVNPHRGSPFKIIHLKPKHRPRAHNPMAASSGPGGFTGFFRQVFTMKTATIGGTAVAAVLVDRQLVPRMMMMVPSGGILDWFKKGIGYFITRLVFALVPAAAIYKWGSKTYGLTYGIAGAGSVAVSAAEYGLNQSGVQTMGELAGTVSMLNGRPDGPLAEWFGGYEGDRGLSGYEGDRPTQALLPAPAPRPRAGDLAEGEEFAETEYAAG